MSLSFTVQPLKDITLNLTRNPQIKKKTQLWSDSSLYAAADHSNISSEIASTQQFCSSYTCYIWLCNGATWFLCYLQRLHSWALNKKKKLMQKWRFLGNVQLHSKKKLSFNSSNLNFVSTALSPFAFKHIKIFIVKTSKTKLFLKAQCCHWV